MRQLTVKSICNTSRTLPVVRQDEKIDSVIKILNSFPSVSHLYILDNENKFIGSLKYIRLLKIISPYLNTLSKDNFDVFRTRLINTEISKIERDDISLTESTTLCDAVLKMIDNNSLNIPIIDNNGNVVADIRSEDIVSILEKK